MTLSFNKLNEIAEIYESIAFSEQEQLDEDINTFAKNGGLLGVLRGNAQNRNTLRNAASNVTSNVNKTGSNLIQTGGIAGGAQRQVALARDAVQGTKSQVPLAAKQAPAPAKYKSSSDGKMYANYNDALAAKNSRNVNKYKSSSDGKMYSNYNDALAAKNSRQKSIASAPAGAKQAPAPGPAKYKSSSDGKMYANYNDALAAKNSRQKSMLKQDFDVFDVVLGHLIDEGYADTQEAATAIMANMSEAWVESIVENRGMSYSGGKPGASGDGGKPTGITGGTTYKMKGWDDDKDAKKEKVKGV